MMREIDRVLLTLKLTVPVVDSDDMSWGRMPYSSPISSLFLRPSLLPFLALTLSVPTLPFSLPFPIHPTRLHFSVPFPLARKLYSVVKSTIFVLLGV